MGGGHWGCAAVTALGGGVRGHGARARSRRAFLGRGLFAFVFPFFLFDLKLVVPVLVVEVELNLVIEMGFLQHLANFAGADLGVQLLFFLVVVQVVFVVARVVMFGVSYSSPSITSSSTRPDPGAKVETARPCHRMPALRQIQPHVPVRGAPFRRLSSSFRPFQTGGTR